MHKWNLRFDVASDPLTLIAELEEKIENSSPTLRNLPSRISNGLITATVEIGGRWVDATVDTGASRSFASEGYVRMKARPEEMQESNTIIADLSSLAVKELWRTRVEIAGTRVWMPFLVMPTMLDRVILGMDFLAAMGTQI